MSQKKIKVMCLICAGDTCLRGAGRKNNWKRYPVTMWHELFWHRLAHICNCLHLWLLTWKCCKWRGTQTGVWSMDRWQCCTRTEDASCREPGRRWGTRVGKRATSGFFSYLRTTGWNPQSPGKYLMSVEFDIQVYDKSKAICMKWTVFFNLERRHLELFVNLSY